LIFSRQATEMFQFAHLPPACLWVQQAVSRHHSGGVAPFGLSGLMACMQLPRNVSPVSASFIGLQRQGIHPVLCRACALDTSVHLSPGLRPVRWIGVMMCSFVLLCFAFAGVFSAKSKSSFSVGKVRAQVPSHLKSGNQSSHQPTLRAPRCHHAVLVKSTWDRRPSLEREDQPHSLERR
jgi:hypothetical protein